jgi:hypothetical protein
VSGNIPSFKYYADDTVSLYRAVGIDEYIQLEETGKFGISEDATLCKYFGVDYDETLAFSNKAYNKHVVSIVEAIVPFSELRGLADFTHVDSTIFKSGTVIIEEKFLDEFNHIVDKMNFL